MVINVPPGLAHRLGFHVILDGPSALCRAVLRYWHLIFVAWLFFCRHVHDFVTRSLSFGPRYRPFSVMEKCALAPFVACLIHLI